MHPRRFGLALLAILLVTALAHSRQFENPFLFFDDPQNVVDNPSIRGFTAENLKTYFTTPLVGMYSPLVYLSFAIDYRIGALDATPYHVTNVALHLVNVLLVALVVRRLTNHEWTGALVALLFGIHPLNVAGVAPVSVRSSLLYSAFYLAAYLAYLRYVRDEARRWLHVALGGFVLAGLSKSSAIVFPAVLILTDVYLGRPLSRRTLLEKLPFLAVSAVLAVLAIVFRADLGVMHSFSLAERLALATYSLTYYVFKLAVPVSLSPLHPYPARLDGHLPIVMYAAPLGLAAAVLLTSRWKSQRRLLTFGALFFLINIVLVLKIVPLGVEFMADRYVYLPSIGLLLVVVEAARSLPRAARRAAAAACLVASAWFAFASYARAADWHDRLSFESRVVAQYPDDPDAHAGLGIALAEAGRLDEAIGHFTRSLALDPSNSATRTNLAAAQANLARTLLAGNRTAEAVTPLRASLQLHDNPATHYLLGSALADLDQLPDAIAEYRAALSDGTLAKSPELHNDLGVALGRLGRRDEAVAEFTEALRLDPSFAPAKANLGIR